MPVSGTARWSATWNLVIWTGWPKRPLAIWLLGADVQGQADRAYQQLKADPRHPSLHRKRIGRFWSVRVGLRHRALAVEASSDVLLKRS